MELAVQKYLRSGKTLEDLKAEFGIYSALHPTEALVIFKYDMIESPKTHPIVRECRGLVLESGKWNVVSKGFNRFYNLGEYPEEHKLFDWNNCSVQEKCDGSLIQISWHNGKKLLTTSGSFGLGEVTFSKKTWIQLFWDTLGIEEKNCLLDENLTHVFELCTAWNKVVRTYAEPTIFLLSLFKNSDHAELSVDECDKYCEKINKLHNIKIKRPELYQLNSEDEVKSFLKGKEDKDPTYEGFVIRDINGIRVKVKSLTYLSLHRMLDNGNILNPKHLVPLALSGEGDEVVTYFPEIKQALAEAKQKIDEEYTNLLKVYKENYHIPTQKDFALAIIKKTKFSSLLFAVRKKAGIIEDVEMLRQLWKESEELITKVIYDN